MAGRPKKPTELKKIQGTYRKDRDTSADVSIAKTNIIIKEDDKVSTPKTIQTRKGKQFYKAVVENLKTLHVLSRVDLTQIETMARYLERMKMVDEEIIKTDINDMERYQYLSNLYDRLSTRFDTLASKYYISPQARVQLKLNELNLIKTSQEITKNDNAINNLLNMRKVAD